MIRFLYSFSHPENINDCGTEPITQVELLKIGRSNNVERRVRQWKKQCKYAPHLRFAYAMPQYHRIERIVHHQLHKVTQG